MKNNIIDIKRSESSLTEPCTLAEAKAQCIVTYSDDDALITSLITKARKAIENYCNISIAAQTVILTADLFTSWELPYGPVTAITGVQKRSGTEGSGPASYATQTEGWNTDGEQFLTFNPFPGGDQIDWGYPYTAREMRSYGFDSGWGWDNRYRITYTTGYSPVPDDLKQVVLMQIAWLYEHRGEEDVSVCEAARILADPYKRQLWL